MKQADIGVCLMGLEIVKYHNNMNEVQFGILNASEMNIFFALCAKVKDNDKEEVRLPFETIRELGKYSATSNLRFKEDMDKTNEKIMELKFKIKSSDGKRRIMFVPFPTFDADEETQVLTVTVNKQLSYILNDPDWFTRFELSEFTDLKGVYAKNLYRLLKQFRSTGFYKVNIDKFREILDIPKSYSMTNIDKRVLEPAFKELEQIFPQLEVNKIKGGRGNKVKSLEFKFSREIIPKQVKQIETTPPKKKTNSYKSGKTEPVPDWAENQPPAQPQKDYTEGEFDNIQDRIANLKSSKKKSGK